jgi:thioredoxin 1
MADNVLTIDDKNFAAEVTESPVPVLVDFWAVWCHPCKMIAPVIEELAGAYSGRVKFGKINVDENRALSSQFGIRSIPALLLFKGGKVVDQMFGAHQKPELMVMLDKVL